MYLILNVFNLYDLPNCEKEEHLVNTSKKQKQKNMKQMCCSFHNSTMNI